MTAFVKYNDVLFLTSTDTWNNQGTNYIDNRTYWTPIDSTMLINGTFTIPAGNVLVQNGSWIQDSGEPYMAPNLREDRAFCNIGKLSFPFTGTNLTARINVDWGWTGTHLVYIDGVQPSTIANVISYNNNLSCDAATYGLTTVTNIDVLLVDGLAPGNHLLEIYANGTALDWLAVIGFKVRQFASLPISANVQILPTATNYPLNDLGLTLGFNQSTNTAINVHVTFPPTIVSNTKANLSPITVSSLNSTNPIQQTIFPVFTGAELSGTYTVPLTISAEYLDPTGNILVPASNVTILANDPSIIENGSSWSIDNLALGGLWRIYSNAPGSNANSLVFTFQGDSLTLTVEQDYGYGIFGIYDSTGTTLYGTITCYNANTTTIYSQTYTGFGAGSHTVMLKKTTTDSSEYVILCSATWQISTSYSLVTETANIILNASQPIGMPVLGANIGATTYSFTPPILSSYDYSTTPARTNIDVTRTEMLSRFPTYAVCYQSGHADILSQYDILIVDPFAAVSADVLAWQAKGIKVFGYISMGEEDGFYTNPYDFTSPNGPFWGDKTGPGGYAGYYRKGGDQAKECNECTYDEQAMQGIKSCSLHLPQYYQPTGRCSAACMNDSRDGYTTFISGGKCAAGFTKLNNWQRASADSACINAACPSYFPVHQNQTGVKCPSYLVNNSAYLQDYSIYTPTFPDENGVWGAFYTNPSPTSGWLNRINSYYIPTVMGGMVPITNEIVTVVSAVTSAGNVLAFTTAVCPIDESGNITLTNTAKTISWQKYVDYSFDMKTGAFVFNANIVNIPTIGEKLIISYIRKGHNMDGIFMDTIDDADVYPAEGTNMSNMIIAMKSMIPSNKSLISNRGFSNLNSYIHTCDGVMFESWLADWNENTGQYYQITNPSDVTWNQQVNDQLTALRQKYTFDVYSLNYCNADSTGDAFREYFKNEDANHGYLSWSSTIDLDTPMPNTNIPSQDKYIKTNIFQITQIKGI